MLLYYIIFQAMRARVHNGPEAMMGKTGVVLKNIDPEGKIKYATEIWNAVADGKKFSKLNKSLDFIPQCGYMKSGYTFEDKIPALDRRI
jgi:hypothetical protein